MTRRKGRSGVRSGACILDRRMARDCRETQRRATSSRSSGPGCTSGCRRATSTCRRSRGASSRIGTGVGVVVIGIALAIMIPRIDDGKRAHGGRGRRLQAPARRRSTARASPRLQQPRTRRARVAQPRRGRARPPSVAAAQQQLSRSVEAAINADAQARAATGEMSKVQGPTDLRAHAAGTPTTGDDRRLRLLHGRRTVPKVKRNPAGAIGYPFRAVVDYQDASPTRSARPSRSRARCIALRRA